MRNQPVSGLESIFMKMTITLSPVGGVKLSMWNLETVYGVEPEDIVQGYPGSISTDVLKQHTSK